MVSSTKFLSHITKLDRFGERESRRVKIISKTAFHTMPGSNVAYSVENILQDGPLSVYYYVYVRDQFKSSVQNHGKCAKVDVCH